VAKSGSDVVAQSVANDGSPLSPRDWLLLSLSGTGQPVDRIRLQKTLFLFSKRSKVPPAEQYTFQPYLYGPFSFQLYPDLDRLVLEGLVRADRLDRTTSPGYSLTRAGQARAERLAQQAPKARVRALTSIRAWVVAQSFRSLLENVYRLYPEYASKSVFR